MRVVSVLFFRSAVRSFAKRPAVWALFTTPISMFAGALAIVMADFGQPLWLFAPIFLLLATIGLPTTVAVILVAASWGWFPATTGFLLFVISAAIVAFAFQTVSFHWCAKRIRRRLEVTL